MENRQRIYLVLIVLVGLIFWVRLFFLQGLDDRFKLAADTYSIRRLVNQPLRGNIFDRKGRVLATNDFAFDLMVIPLETKEMDTLALAALTEVPIEEVRKAWEKVNKNIEKKRRFKKQPQPLIRDLSQKSIAAFQEKMYRFPGLYVEKRSVRRYPEPHAAHALGYAREADASVLEKDAYYQPGDYVGVAGIERAYETYLRGIKGVRKVYVDVRNNEKGSYMDGLYDTLPVPGADLMSTLDIELQKYAELLMQGKRGAIVAIEPATGEILVLVSSPSYDPNWMVGRNLRQHYGALILDPAKPMLNRAVMDGYPPGSTFKVMNAMLGLQAGVINPATVVPCGGGFRLSAAHTVGCHGHPNADLRFSITTSCNAYYCHVFNELTKTNSSPRQAYKDWYLGAQRFGFGTKLGTDIPEAKSGLLPSPEYYDRMHGLGKWRGLTIISLGIGQGELKANALHIANLAAIIANRGYFISPHLGKALNGKPMPDTLFKHNYTRVDTAHFQIAWEGMYGAVHKPGGTAKIARLDSIAVYGKTGTAQNPHGKDHSVFMAFAPSKSPKIAIGVFVENGGFGATYAAPIASLIIEKYLTDTITRAGLEERLLKTRLE